ncbi:MAG: hydantoinase/oxoprolinase family protein [Saccharofermentanales bacterium]|jgi:N-methylhydantoinase A
MSKRQVRVGIDVGGTHTKAVALDNRTNEIIGQSVVLTTHDHEMGVAAGVIDCFQRCLFENDIAPQDVVFIAHSTTQATNALLEGDVANVGIVGISKGGIEGLLARKQSNIPDIDLGTGRMIRTIHSHLKTSELTEDKVNALVKDLKSKGAGVIVASKAFGVDSLEEEEFVTEIASKHDLLVTVASDISKLYGLTRRTRTAAINASILPKMLETANSTEDSVRQAGIDVPLMIMRGDGGVMSIEEMRRRPILTMLSGPAASIMGALLYLRASNGVYFEVGGTSTNIGVIRNGRPAVEYSIVGGHPTYVSSLDVRVLGVAGGSLIRVGHNKLIDVGPRSAHIAGLKYAVYTPVEEIVNPKVEFFSPREGDPADYVRIRFENGDCVGITNSCAANVLGLVRPEDYAYGIKESAVLCMQPLADMMGITVEELARQILHKAYEKIKVVIQTLLEKYRLQSDQISLVGVGGGAAALLPYTADQLSMRYSIPQYAEVISSIGVALSMIRDVVERIIPNPTTEDITRLKNEAADLVIKNGAVPDTVEVQIEIDPQTSKVTAIAIGSNEVQATDLSLNVDEHGAREIAADSFRASLEDTYLLLKDDNFFIFGHKSGDKEQIRLVDKRGFVRVQLSDAMALVCQVKDWRPAVRYLWDNMISYRREMAMPPDVYLCVGPKIFDFSNTLELSQLIIIMESELKFQDPARDIFLIASKNEII